MKLYKMPVYFHRVRHVDSSTATFGPDVANAVTTKAFERFLATYQERLVPATSLDNDSADDRLKEGREPSLLLTFDDAYRDFADVVLPRLEAFNVRALLFVVVAFADGERTPVEYRLADLLVQCSDYVCDHGFGYPLPDDAARADFYQRMWGEIKRRTPAERERRLASLAQENGFDRESLKGPPLLNWFDLRTLSKHPCVEIGAHSLTHPFLPSLGATACWREIADSRRYLEACLAHKIHYFAYPYGAAHTRERLFAKLAGFAEAFTTEKKDNKRWPHRTAQPRLSTTDFPELNTSV